MESRIDSDIRAVEASCPGRISSSGTHYWIRGEGGGRGVVVCVHGIGSYHSCFNVVADDLVRAGFVVVLYDLIGRGYSLPSPNQRYGRQEHVSQLLALLQEIHDSLSVPPPYHFICHSMGGALGALFVHAHPEYVRSLTLLAPAGLLGYMPVGLLVSLPRCLQACIRGVISSESNEKKAWGEGYHDISKSEVRKMRDDCVADHTQMYARNPEMRNAFWQSVLQFPLRNIDEEVKALGKRRDLKVLLLWGDKDLAVPFSPSYDRWKSYLSPKETEACHLESKVYPNVGHCFYEEIAPIVMPDIRQFLEKSF